MLILLIAQVNLMPKISQQTPRPDLGKMSNFTMRDPIPGIENVDETAILSTAPNQPKSRGGLSGRWRRPSEAACAKRGSIGQMRRPAELVPIPEYLLGTPGRLRKVAVFWKNPE